MELATLTAADFALCLNDVFCIQHSVLAPGANAPLLRTFVLTLSEIDEFGSQTPTNSRCGFSLIFVGEPSAHYLPQHTYTVTHATLPPLTIFLTPIGAAPGGSAASTQRMRYQAIFN
jgi:hypothetical protein